jgi:DNA-binding NarL/FixJ family response regulator
VQTGLASLGILPGVSSSNESTGSVIHLLPRAREHEGRVVELHHVRGLVARRNRFESGRVATGWPRDLTVLDGGALGYQQPARSSGPIRVVLAEGAALVRAGLRSLLDGEADITVAGEAASGTRAVSLIAELLPDVVLMGIRLPGLDGLAATRRLTSDPQLSGVKVIVVTKDENDEDLFGALGSGASGFVLLDSEPGDFVRAVRVVAGGGAHLSPWATRRVLEELASIPDSRPSDSQEFEELTTRECHIVLMVAQGMSNSEIADRLVISPATVKTHVSRAMTKLHARDRAKLVALAHQSGFVKRCQSSAARPPAALPPVAGRHL